MAWGFSLPQYAKLPNSEFEAVEKRSHGFSRGRPRFCQSLSGLTAVSVGLITLSLTIIYLCIKNNSAKAETVIPDIHSTRVLFEPDYLYMSDPSPESNYAWDELMPSGGGFVLIEDPEAYGLGPGIPTDVGPEKYSVSMFHQLHCLGMLRESYYAAVDGRHAHVYVEENLEGSERDFVHGEHVGHCFDYLRQAIMCAADMTLESAARPLPGVVPFTVDGWGIEHQCRSWEAAVKWTLEHKAPSVHSGIA